MLNSLSWDDQLKQSIVCMDIYMYNVQRSVPTNANTATTTCMRCCLYGHSFKEGMERIAMKMKMDGICAMFVLTNLLKTAIFYTLLS